MWCSTTYLLCIQVYVVTIKSATALVRKPDDKPKAKSFAAAAGGFAVIGRGLMGQITAHNTPGSSFPHSHVVGVSIVLTRCGCQCAT